MLKTLTVIFLLPFELGGCYSYRQIRQPGLISDQIKNQGTAQETVYVVNSKALPYEYRILKKSGLYAFTSNSSCNTKIQLMPLEKHRARFHCMTATFPATVMAVVTLGQFRMRFQKNYAFHYYLVNDSISVKKENELTVNKRVSFRDTFSFEKSRQNALAKDLQHLAKNLSQPLFRPL